jgi:hypothetical protein
LEKSKITDFNKLVIASQMDCEDCDLYKDVYLDTQHFLREGLLEKDEKFTEVLLADFEAHIIEKHPERARAFLKDE